MHHILVVGMGPGDPELVTVKAVRAINGADVILIPRKGEDKAELAEQRREICRRYLDSPATRLIEFDLPRRRSAGASGYLDAVNDWHDTIATTYAAIIRDELPAGGRLALLVWGDPSVYDSTLRILQRLGAGHGVDIDVEMIPGVTSVQALTASHRIPLNTLGGAVLYTTGRRLREGVPAGVDTVVVMLDGEGSFRFVPPEGFDIYWGANLGLGSEVIHAGPLDQVSATIVAAREQTRARVGWVMDVYVLRRRGGA